MRGLVRLLLLPRIVGLAALFWAAALWGQSAFVTITPSAATMLVGESRPFRLVDQNGRTQRNVSWTISDPGALQADKGDELVVTAKQPGDFRISAHSGNGTAEATVKVMEGTSVPKGAAKWSSPSLEGCKPMEIKPAVPSASGIDIYVMTQCGDGQYLEAYTAEGIQVWRQKVSGGSGPTPVPRAVPGNPSAPASPNQTVAERLNQNSTSICDQVSLGTDQHKIHDLLERRKLSFSGDSAQSRVWLVEESGTQCKLWFDDKSLLTKKRKILTSE